MTERLEGKRVQECIRANQSTQATRQMEFSKARRSVMNSCVSDGQTQGKEKQLSTEEILSKGKPLEA